MRQTRRRWLLTLSLLTCAALAALLPWARGQQIHRNGFEARTPAWIKGAADAPNKEAVHDVTDQTAHSGQFAEHIQLTAESGSYIHYTYGLGRAPLAEDLSISLWVKANRPGTQLLARVVLPREHGDATLNEPLTVMLRGDAYEFVGRWQRLELRRPLKLAKEQQQLLRTELKRDVDFTDAFIDRLVLNVYGGPGLTEVWIDDLEAGPVTEAEPIVQPTPPTREAPGTLTTMQPPPQPIRRQPRGAVVELNQDHLFVSGKRFLFRVIRHTDTPLEALRDAGFNTVCLDANAPAALREEAVNLGFWLLPTLPVDTHQPAPAQAAYLARLVAQFPDSDAVIGWDLGGGHTFEEAPLMGRIAQDIHAADSQRPISADIWDGFLPYSRSLDMVGAHRWPLMTNLELTQYYLWLNQRRLLARPGTFQWTWIQTHLPDWYLALIHDRKPESEGRSTTGFQEPIGPQPEQIRLLTYTALAAGCQGLGFWSDRYLADSHQGHDRLLQLALLNQEIQMLEPMLLATVEPPQWIDTSSRDVKAAVLRTDRGVLVLPMWMGLGAQFVPGQAAMVKLSIVVPQVPDGTQAWEVTPGDVRSLYAERVPGGTKVTIPEFGLTTAIVFTADNSPTGMLVRLQDQARRMRKLAAQWAWQLAAAEIEKVLPIEAELERMGHSLPDAKELQDNAQARLKRAKEYWTSGDYREAYFEAQRALRPLRILMRAQWEKAVRELDTVTASPYALSFYTLPRHWEFRDKIQQAKALENVLPDGGFEVGPDQAPSKWVPQEVTIDNVKMDAWRVLGSPRPATVSSPGTILTPRLDAKPVGIPANLEKPAAMLLGSDATARGQMGSTDDVRPGSDATPKVGLPLDAAGNPLPVGPKSASEPDAPPAPDKPKPPPKSVEPIAKEGERCLKLVITAKPPEPKETDPKQVDPKTTDPKQKSAKPADTKPTGPPPAAVLERTFLAINSPAVTLPAGTLVRISAWMYLPGGISGTVDGAMFYDSVGGEPLAVRITIPTVGWKKFTLYRQVPASGQISVTLALTGYGTAYFDDVRIEPLQVSRAAYHGWTQWGEQAPAR